MPPSLARTEAARAEAPQTLKASALSQLRSDIIACRLMPNERLRVEALRERYGMGISPIREALMRLEAEGLVELEQNKGFRVSEVSHENLLDLMRSRIEIETIALRWSLEKGGVEWEANLLGAFHRLSRQSQDRSGAIPTPSTTAWSREHAEFPRGTGLRMRLADNDGDPLAAVRTGRALCRALDHVERAAARRRRASTSN